MEYRRRSFMMEDPLINEQMEKEHYTGTAFSYYESIQEFNQYRYGGLSYSMYHIWKHLLHLICGCGSRRTK
jgi:hypothetical protein